MSLPGVTRDVNPRGDIRKDDLAVQLSASLIAQFCILTYEIQTRLGIKTPSTPRQTIFALPLLQSMYPLEQGFNAIANLFFTACPRIENPSALLLPFVPWDDKQWDRVLWSKRSQLVQAFNRMYSGQVKCAPAHSCCVDFVTRLAWTYKTLASRICGYKLSTTNELIRSPFNRESTTKNDGRTCIKMQDWLLTWLHGNSVQMCTDDDKIFSNYVAVICDCRYVLW